MKKLQMAMLVSSGIGFYGLLFTGIYYVEKCGAYGRNCSNTQQGVLATLASIFGLMIVVGLIAVLIYVLTLIKKKNR